MDYLDRLRTYAKRNKEMRSLWRKGWTKANLARRYNISRQRVDKVLQKT